MTVPPELIVRAEDWPYGLKCGECRSPLEEGDRYAERLTGMAGATPVVLITCQSCDISGGDPAVTVAEFLTARLAEDEATACRVKPDQALVELRALVMRDGGEPFLVIDSGRVLRQVTAMRAILAGHPRVWPGDPGSVACTRCVLAWPCPTLRHLAAVWSDHPDYDGSWRP